MSSFRQRLAHLVLALAAVAWVTGWGASLVHRSVTVHVECAEHGDVVDLGGPTASAAEDDRPHGATIRATDAGDDHEHGCTLHGVSHARVPVLAVTVERAPGIERSDDPVPTLTTPRGPPLGYAPKTSPPIVS